MKKILAFTILSAALLFAGNSYAQLGIHAGYAPDSWANENTTTDINSFFVGVDNNIVLTGDLRLLVGAGLRYGTESGNSSLYGIASGQHTTTLIGVDVPVLLNYSFNLSGDLSLGLFAGAKLNYAISGKTKYEGNVLGLVSGSTEVEWFGDENGALNLNPLNLSATFGLALNFRQFRLYGGYNYGLLDVDNNDNTKTTVSGPFFGVGIQL